MACALGPEESEEKLGPLCCAWARRETPAVSPFLGSGTRGIINRAGGVNGYGDAA